MLRTINPVSSFVRNNSSLLLMSFALLMLGAHWLHLRADPAWKMGFLTGQDWAGDFFTDEGWEANAATRAVLNGNWHVLGEVNLAVESPLWPAILYLPFKLFGVSITVARSIATGFYACSILGTFLFVKRLSDDLSASLAAALLSVNLLGFTFGRAALVEPVFTCFVVLALLMALYAADRASLPLSILAGLVLSLGIVVKLTALFAVVPMLSILWLRSRGDRNRVALIMSALVAAAMLPAMHHIFVMSHYQQEQKIYLQMNVTDRKVSGSLQWLFALARIAYGLRAVGPFLLGAFCVAAVLFLFCCRGKLQDPLLKLGFIWLLANVAIFSTVKYFPPRYSLSLMFPLVIVTVRFATIVRESGSRWSIAPYALLILSLVFDSVQGLGHLLRSQYTMLGVANEIRRSLPAGNQSDCSMSGFMANTLSLYNGLSSANLTWGIQPMWIRIQACEPKVFISREELTKETMQEFTLAGKTLQLRETFLALPGHAGDRPENVYSVMPSHLKEIPAE